MPQETPDSSYMAARSLILELKYAQAMDKFSEVIKEGNSPVDSHELYFGLATCHYGLGQYQEAATVYLTNCLIESQPVQFMLGQCFMRVQESSSSLLLEGLSFFEEAKYEQAIEKISKTIEGNEFVDEQKIEKLEDPQAKEVLREAKQLLTRNASYILASCHHKLGSHQKAIDTLLAGADQNNPKVHDLFSKCYEAQLPYYRAYPELLGEIRGKAIASAIRSFELAVTTPAAASATTSSAPAPDVTRPLRKTLV